MPPTPASNPLPPYFLPGLITFGMCVVAFTIRLFSTPAFKVCDRCGKAEAKFISRAGFGTAHHGKRGQMICAACDDLDEVARRG